MNLSIDVISDLETARELWLHFYRDTERFFHQWEVRLAFHDEFAHRLHFLVARENNDLVGFLPLCFAAEINAYVYFAGELWREKTWLESNRLFANHEEILNAMLATLDHDFYLRYLESPTLEPPTNELTLSLDEIGYLFYPADYNYDFNNYWQKFSAKTRKKFEKEIDALNAQGVVFHYQRYHDLDWLITTNVAAFGEYSYFADERFARSFRRLISWLNTQNFLRITTVEIGGKIAAVDVGALINNYYTVLAGGAHREFVGVAKMINFHHLQFACTARLNEVDFLCGDFGWKERFLLTPRPLYLMRRTKNDC